MNNSFWIAICIISFSVSGCTGLGLSTDPTLGFALIEGQELDENLWGEAAQELPDEVAVEGLADSNAADVLRGTDDDPAWNGYGSPGESTPRLDRVLERIMFVYGSEGRDARTAHAR